MARIVGIDLGTSNCALAWVDPAAGAAAAVQDFAVPQLVRPGEVSARALLPSCVYLPPEHEAASAAYRLPDAQADAPRVVGELARWQGARVPGRVVTSAKSWLCHPGVDRQAAILPWGAPADVPRLSPVTASALFLGHLRAAWDRAHPDAPLAAQDVVVTVPASFDEAARALTVSAARQAGLERFTLLEEPQAAFYDFTSRHRSTLGQALTGIRLVLVVDVGGGTTDFTLVQVEALPEGAAMRRIAVGDHLLLGGDNMDAALAHHAQQALGDRGRKLTAGQWTQLVQASRAAKESLLTAGAPDRIGISIAGDGARLIGGTLSTELTRAALDTVVLEGFFPRSAVDEGPRRRSGVALQEMGLPYVQDPAITRHLAAFLRTHADAAWTALGRAPDSPTALPRPDAILLNGGVFNAERLSNALVDAVSAWWPDRPRLPLLDHGSLDLAVARGAAYYGLTRRGFGRKIGGGTARAYYVRISAGESSAALCLIPRGFEEGESVTLRDRAFSLTLGRPVQFELLSSSADRIDKPGDVVTVEGDDLKPLPPIQTILSSPSGKTGVASVLLTAALTEIGTLELSAAQGDERWRLEFELRGAHARRSLSITESMPARFAEATEQIQHVYGHKPLPLAASDVKQLWRSLERILGPREGWRVPVLRELWGALYAGASKRRRSADHERLFFQLCGYALRPGFGYPLDGWRAEQTFRLFAEGVTNHPDKAVWIEFWVMWRRVAAGLSEASQRALWEYLSPHLERRVPLNAPKPKERPRGVQPEGLDEMVRAAAALEHLEADEKERLGGWIAERLRAPETRGGPWAWALGRLGARAPIYGSLHRTVSPGVAETWASLLLELGLSRVDGASFALAQLVRLTGDHARDVDDGLRDRALEALRKAGAAPAWLDLVVAPREMNADEESRALGDTLPAGLTLDAGP